MGKLIEMAYEEVSLDKLRDSYIFHSSYNRKWYCFNKLKTLKYFAKTIDGVICL